MNATTQPNRIIRMKELMHLTGLSRSSIYAFLKSGVMGGKIKLGTRAVGFLESDVLAFIAARVAASRGAA